MFLCCFQDNSENDSDIPSVSMSNLQNRENGTFRPIYPSLEGMRNVSTGIENTPGHLHPRTLTKDDWGRNERTLSNAKLFEDFAFHHLDEKTLNNYQWQKAVVWKRPKDICTNPKFFVDGTSRFDVEQGSLGDCWLLAAMSSLAMRSDLLDQVIFPDQSFRHPNYVGSFRFRFYHFGKWNEIVIDDHLPCFKYRNGKLMFVSSSASNEFWSPLLEKAYAKWNGSYKALDGGFGARGLTAFTGGCVETYHLPDESPGKITRILRSAKQKCSIMTAGTPCGRSREAKGEQGIILGHAYSITNVVPEFGLVRLRNPWGRGEWTGPWSDDSPEWNQLNDTNLKAGLDFKNKIDGEFYMSIQDFVRIFNMLSICNVSHLKPGMAWHEEKIYGSWINHISAGGYSSWKSFAKNPQFKIVLKDSDLDSDNVCTVIISLMNKELKDWRKFKAGFRIFGGDNTTKCLAEKDFKNEMKKPIGTSGKLEYFPEVTKRFELKPGTYVIIPFTENPNQEAEFLLRVFSERQCHLKALKKP